MKIDERHLVQLAAVVQTGGVTEGAAFLGLAQPAVSRTISMLEKRLGEPLFIKGRRPLQPTPLGRALAEHGQSMMAAARKASDTVESFRVGKSGVVRVASIYLPNGNPADDPVKYPYKLNWMARLEAYARERLALEEPLVIAGDYNAIPEPHDCWDPKVWENDALFLPQTRQAFRRLENLGLTDAVRASTDGVPAYTFWDYQAGAWQKNNGLRIDHLLLSPQAADRLTAVGIDKGERGKPEPSDHVPVWCELDVG